MATSPLVAFANFLGSHNYSTTMWENGYTQDETNHVCHELTEWGRQELQLQGEFIMVWSNCTDIQFSGDSELAYTADGVAYLVPNPFIEGDSEGFVSALLRIVHGNLGELYECSVESRILYNAV